MSNQPEATKLPPQAKLESYYQNDQERRQLVRELFDEAAEGYDRAETLTSFGNGRAYRRQALERAGLTAGMRMLDVATGTGLVAREAIKLLGGPEGLVGLDPTPGMLAQARKNLRIETVEAYAEAIPLKDARFDFLSMGYALRHVSDLLLTFREFYRVLAPGGRVCVLEITRPRTRVATLTMKCYIRGIVPMLSLFTAKGRKAGKLWKYYWDTIIACVDPETILQSMRDAGFVDVKRHVAMGTFSEYTGRRPDDQA
jgi:demethylmenaquinone methyltransferase/2-methoxy-6-polyprenyl-1,4-benzoquinol methylase